MKAAFTIRIDDELAAKLDDLAKQTDRSRSWLAARAIEDYVALNEWQIAKIKEGIADADAGRFASDEEVEAVFARYRSAG